GLGKTLADEVASPKSATRIVDTGSRSEASTVRRARGNDIAHVAEHRDLQYREQQESKQNGDHRELGDRGASLASAASGEHSNAHEQRVAHCYPPVLPVTESMASLIALVILSRNSAKMTTTSPAVMIVTITQPGTSPRSGSSPRTRAYVSRTQAASRSIDMPRPPRSTGERYERDETGVQREQHGHRQDQKHH